jgi:hypothetical protein
MGGIILRALGWGVVGLFVVPLVMFGIMAVVYQLSSQCGTAGDSGGCEMGMAVVIFGSALPGAIVFFLFVLIRGLNRRQQPPAN